MEHGLTRKHQLTSVALDCLDVLCSRSEPWLCVILACSQERHSLPLGCILAASFPSPHLTAPLALTRPSPMLRLQINVLLPWHRRLITLLSLSESPGEHQRFTERPASSPARPQPANTHNCRNDCDYASITGVAWSLLARRETQPVAQPVAQPDHKRGQVLS